MATSALSSPTSLDTADEEARVEALLSDKLMDGYVLLEVSCPACATPLVKNDMNIADDDDGIQNHHSHNSNNHMEPVIVPSQSFEQPFSPVNGVPFCVACQSHVVTDESDISLLEKCDSLKHKGSILVALNGETSYTTTDPTMVGASHSSEDEVLPSGLSAIASEDSAGGLYEKNDSVESGYADEKKEDEPLSTAPSATSMEHSYQAMELTAADDIMAEYSVR
jgi:hypothetical protein